MGIGCISDTDPQPLTVRSHLGQYAICTVLDCISKRLNFSTLKYQNIHDMIDAIGIGEQNICTYCWNGKE